MLSTTVTIIQQINKGELKDYNRIQTDTHAYTIMAKTNRSKDIKLLSLIQVMVNQYEPA